MNDLADGAKLESLERVAITTWPGQEPVIGVPSRWSGSAGLGLHSSVQPSGHVTILPFTEQDICKGLNPDTLVGKFAASADRRMDLGQVTSLFSKLTPRIFDLYFPKLPP